MVGHSFVKWAALFAEKQIYGRSLGIPSAQHKVVWKGKGGMKWADLFPTLTHMFHMRGCPDHLIIHLGENDLVTMSGLTLNKQMQLDLTVLKTNWPTTRLFWTEFIYRQSWRQARSHAAVEKARRKLNKAMRVFCNVMKIGVLSHDNISSSESHLFRDDGVHLSQLGMAYYLVEIRDMLAQELQVNLWCNSKL
ncbi:uncharacterized protein LOC144755756 [Lissotriton helveticus]